MSTTLHNQFTTEAAAANGELYYKAVRASHLPNPHTSHYDRKTLWVPGQEIVAPNAVADGQQCGAGIHVCKTLLEAVSYQTSVGQAPHCSEYLLVQPTSDLLGSADGKYRFRSVLPVRFLTAEETDAKAGFRLWEANHPVNPLLVTGVDALAEGALQRHLCEWASVRASVWASVGDSVWPSVWASVGASVGASVRASVGDSVWASVGDSVWPSVWASVGDSVWDSVGASVGAYCGSLFPGVTTWKYAESLGPDPWRPLRTLWCAGYLPSRDHLGTWRLHRGPKAEIVLTLTAEQIAAMKEATK